MSVYQLELNKYLYDQTLRTIQIIKILSAMDTHLAEDGYCSIAEIHEELCKLNKHNINTNIYQVKEILEYAFKATLLVKFDNSEVGYRINKCKSLQTNP